MGNKGYENKPQRPEPNYDNVHFIDEYPELQKKLWLRRLNAQRSAGQLALFPRDPNQMVIEFPAPTSPPTSTPDTGSPSPA